MKVPKKFYNSKDPLYPVVARNVGELKIALAELPDDLPIEAGFSATGVDVVVYNMGVDFGPPHLELRERETDDEEWDEED